MTADYIKGLGVAFAAVASLLLGSQPTATSDIPMSVERKFGSTPVVSPFVLVSPTSTNAATTTRQFGTLSPQINNSYGLGEPSFSWGNIYASGTAVVGSVSSSGSTPASFTNLTWTNATGTNTTSTNLSVTNASTTRLVVDATSTSAYFAASRLGTATAPAFTFSGDSDTGLYSIGANQLDVSSGGVIQFDFNGSTNRSWNTIDVGTNNAYDLGAANSGAWRNVYASGTANLFAVTSTSVTSTNFFATTASATTLFVDGTATGNKFRATLGTQSVPSYSFTGDTNTGLFIVASGRLGIAAGGNTPMSWTNTTIYQASAAVNSNNAYDLGTISAAFRDIYASGTIAVAGVTSTGSATSTFAGPVSSTRLVVSNLPAAPTGINPICVGSDGETYIGSSSICPLSALEGKENLAPISYGLKEILATDFYDFKLKQDDGRIHSGPIADYSDKNMPNLTEWKDGKINGFDYLSMIGVEGQAIKELHAENEALKARLVKIENRVGILERIMGAFKKLFR